MVFTTSLLRQHYDNHVTQFCRGHAVMTPDLGVFLQLQQYLDRLLLDKYERYALATYLRTNPNVRMCPGVGCDYAVVRDKKPMYPDGLWTDTGTQCKQTGGRAKVADEGQDERHVGRAVGPGHRDRPAAVVLIATLSCTFSALIPFVCLTGWSF